MNDPCCKKCNATVSMGRCMAGCGSFNYKRYDRYHSGRASAAKAARIRKPPMCEECGKYPADPPRRICVGCEAYREHTGRF